MDIPCIWMPLFAPQYLVKVSLLWHSKRLYFVPTEIANSMEGYLLVATSKVSYSLFHLYIYAVLSVVCVSHYIILGQGLSMSLVFSN